MKEFRILSDIVWSLLHSYCVASPIDPNWDRFIGLHQAGFYLLLTCLASKIGNIVIKSNGLLNLLTLWVLQVWSRKLFLKFCFSSNSTGKTIFLREANSQHWTNQGLIRLQKIISKEIEAMNWILEMIFVTGDVLNDKINDLRNSLDNIWNSFLNLPSELKRSQKSNSDATSS